MSQLFNQFSYPIFAIAALALVFFVLRRRVGLRALVAVEAVIALAFLAGFLALRTGDGDAADVANYEAIISNGQPTFIEFYSNYCTACLMARPAVDALIDDIRPTFNILRVNVHSDVGLPMVAAYGFRYTPEFVLLNPDGEELWRGHTPPDTGILTAASAG